MMVNPDEISASKAPSTKPLKHCDKKFVQLIIGRTIRTCSRDVAAAGAGRPRRNRSCRDSGVVAEIAAEGVRLLHQWRARQYFEDVPIVLLVLHCIGGLALDDDDGPDELMVFLAEVDLAHGRVELLVLLVLLDDVRRI